MLRRNLGIAVFLLVATGMPATRLEAQSDAEYLNAVNFRFDNPGAHARRLGGAFVALANDATAARVNPAGLANFEHPQAALEFRVAEHDFPAARVETGRTSPDDLEQIRPPRRAEISSTSNHLSYLSWIQPFGERQFVLGFFYERPLDVDNLVLVEDAAFPEIASDAFRGATFNSVVASQDMLGASVGLRLGDRISVGASIGISKFELVGSSFSRIGDPNGRRSDSVADDSAVFVTVGGLWRATPRLTVGGAWQSPTGHAMRSTDSVSPSRVISSDFTIPGRISLGLTVTPTDRLLLSLESDWIDYSEMLDDAPDKSFFGDTSSDPSYGYAIEDVTELHLGAEFLIREGSEGWSLSAGYWRDETNPPYYTGDGNSVDAAWAPEQDEALHHLTLGVGLRTGQMRFDLALDHSVDAGTDALFGIVAWFGK